MKAKLKVKPLSINDNCPIKKTAYFEEIARQLPSKVKLPKGRLKIEFTFYFSNEKQDWDSAIKYTQDAIFEAWNLQDAGIYRGIVDKKIASKGKERVVFRITKLRGTNMIKPYIELIKFIIYTTIGAFIREYFDLISTIQQASF